MNYDLFCTYADKPPHALGQEVTLLWTQLPDQSWFYCNRGIQAWAEKMAKYGIVIASRYDFENETELATFIEDDILRFTRIGDLVADPFCGSSTVGEVALKMHRNYVGTDFSRPCIERSETRLSRVQHGY